MNDFLQDVLRGLTASPKYLESKYFYDATGDELFKSIMNCEEYYLTRCELDIFQNRSMEMAKGFASHAEDFDIVELGAGDATKSIHLLQAFMSQQLPFTYLPIDISTNVINYLHAQLPLQLPGLQMHGLNGDYFDMLEKAKTISSKKKIVLFLGSNIGNVPWDKTAEFFRMLHSHLLPGDMLLTGFDLQKDPQVILDAYNDKKGFTREFNLNLLRRINRELSGNFDLSLFKHFPIYDPQHGTCKSYLVSMQEQQVEVADETIHFYPYETIFMEVAQKYTIQQIDMLASTTGFTTMHHYYDSRKGFVDALWQCL